MSEIRRTAGENGGVPVGKARFLALTGIAEADWLGRWWTTWSAAVREAGFEPQKMNPRLADEAVIAATVQICRTLGHFPTAAEIRMQCTADRALPSHNTFRRFGGLDGLRDRTREHALALHAMDILAMLGGAEPSAVPEASGIADGAIQDGFVYLIKSGRHFKIGKARSASKRYRELAIQLPQEATLVHKIATDDAYGIERYWHRRFEDRRLNGEWFDLSAADVKAFRRRKFM